MADFNLGSEIVNSASNIASNAANNLYNNFAASNPNIANALASVGIGPGAAPAPGTFTEGTWEGAHSTDWRVKLSMPPVGNWTDSPLMKLLEPTGGLVFPYTPTVYIQHQASYGSVHPTHSNYPFPTYTHSSVDAIQITGDFTVENQEEAQYWVAALYYLKSVTKMAYGEAKNILGAPPPVVKLNGYGDFVFKDVPVVVSTFNVNLDAEVDYIDSHLGSKGSWAPTKSTIAVTLTPAYSRDKVNKFSFDKFIAGDYNFNPTGSTYL